MIQDNIPLNPLTDNTFSLRNPEFYTLERENKSFYIIRSYKTLDEELPQKVLSEEEIESIISPTINKFKLQGSFDEVFGLWKGRKINLDEIREQQWGRKIR